MFFALRRLGRRELSEYQHNRVQSRGAHAARKGRVPCGPFPFPKVGVSPNARAACGAWCSSSPSSCSYAPQARWPSSATAIGTASRTTSSSSRSAQRPRCRCCFSAMDPCKLHRRLGRFAGHQPRRGGVDLRSRHHRQLPHSARHRRRALPENRLLRADQLGVVR